MTEKVYYRHVREGQRGYRVQRDGKDLIKLDRPSEDIVVPFREHEWMLDRESRPLNAQQVARASFEADKAICEAMGLHLESRRDWRNMTDEQRIKWITQGPAAGLRRQVYDAIAAATRPYTVE
jgi:hypothetical protein